jgi:hypothetical protein
MMLKAADRRRARMIGAVTLSVIAAAAFGTGRRPQAHARSSTVTWAEHVAPLLQRHCWSCHAPGHSSTSPLTEYAQAVEARLPIKRAVLARTMPPWNAVPGFGAFANDHGLSAYETELLVSWLDGGMMPGSPATISDPRPAESSAAPPGDPDLMLDIGADRAIDAARQAYRLRTALPADRWIRGWRFYPGNGTLVQRARIIVEPETLLGVWLPDEPEVFFAAPQARRLPRGGGLRLEIDYAEPPAPASDRSRLGLYFGEATSAPLEQQRIGKGTTSLPDDIEIVAVTPVLAATGQSIRIVATRPDRSIEPLLWLTGYNPRFARSYRLQRPIVLPRGSRIDVWSFDAAPSVEITYVKATTASRQRVR